MKRWFADNGIEASANRKYGGLKKWIDFLYPKWNSKAPGCVGYGQPRGPRAVESLRLVNIERQFDVSKLSGTFQSGMH